MSKLAELTVSVKITLKYRVKEDYIGPPSLDLIKQQLNAVCEEFASEGPESMEVVDGSIAVEHFALGDI